MIFDYKAFPCSNGIIYRPVLSIKIYIGARNFTTLAVLDTGCDKTLLNKDIADNLYVDLKKCPKGSTCGVNGSPIITYESEIDFEIPGLSSKIQKAQISYAKVSNVGILLGHIGFFEYFNVRFDTAQKQFEIIQNAKIN